MNKNCPTSLAKQKGIAFWHIMLLVGIAVTLAVCAKKGTVPYFQKEAPVVGKLNVPDMPELPKFPSLTTASNTTQQTGQQYYNKPVEVHTPTPTNTTVTHVTDNNVESLMTSNKTTQVAAPPPKGTSYEVEYPRDLASGYYTVQVFSGYNSKSAYDLQKALKRDGYRSYIHSEETGQGILFKVRIGQYTNRSDAFAMKSKIRRSYPKKMGKSFVLLRQ